MSDQSPQRNQIAKSNLPQYQLYSATVKGNRFIRTPEENTYDPTNEPGVLATLPEGTYLTRMPNESQDSFSVRKARASYRNYCQEVIRVYLATFFAAGNQVDRSTVLESLGDNLSNNIDLRGTPVDAFLRAGEREALTHGWVLALTDLTNSETFQINSLADEQKLIRPYTRWVVASNVWDWRRDPITHELLYLLLYEGKHPSYGDQEVWSIWDRTSWAIVDKDGEVLKTGNHNLGTVPADILICDEPSEDNDTEPFGHSALAAVADLQLELYRTSSNLEDLLRKTAFAEKVFTAPEGSSELDNIKGKVPVGPDFAIVTSATVKWIAPPPDSARVLAEQIEKLGKDIRELAGIAARSQESTEAHSGEALAWEYSTKHSLVKLRAEQLRNFECKLWRRYSKLLNKEIPWASVHYPSEYATALGPTDKLDLKTLIEIKAPLSIIRKHFRAQVLKEYSHLPDLKGLFAEIEEWTPEKEWPIPAAKTNQEPSTVAAGTPGAPEATEPTAPQIDPVEAMAKTLDTASKVLALVTTLTQNHAPQAAIRALVTRAFELIGITDSAVIQSIMGNEFAWYADTSQVDPTTALPPDSKIP